jgi:hypothetical protein
MNGWTENRGGFLRPDTLNDRSHGCREGARNFVSGGTIAPADTKSGTAQVRCRLSMLHEASLVEDAHDGVEARLVRIAQKYCRRQPPQQNLLPLNLPYEPAR